MITLGTPVRWSVYTGRVVEIVPARTAPAAFKTPGRIGLRDRISYVVDCGGTRYWPTVQLRVVGARPSTPRRSRKGERGAVSVSASFYGRLVAYADHCGASMSSIVEERLIVMLGAHDAAARS